MKPTLIVVKSPQNDKNSESYLKRIKSCWKDYYDDEINLDIPDKPFETQEQLNNYLERNSGSVLLLHPTNLKLYGRDKTRNIENDQVVTAIISNIPENFRCSKVLLYGSGNVNEALDDRLRYKGRIIATCAHQDRQYLDDEFLSHFNLIVNSTRYDAEVKMFYSNNVIDTAGNFKPLSKKHWDDKNIEYTQEPHPQIVTRGEIGKLTADLMLQDVIENGF